jgi:hypothetical protein
MKTVHEFLDNFYKQERGQIIREQEQVKIPVEHPGVLEVPEGKNVEDLGEDHFKTLIKKKGWNEISKALTNLQTWNKEKDPKLSGWANGIQARLSKWVDTERETNKDFAS